MAKYVLSTGRVTEKVEQYVLDLFNLILNILPKDIPNSMIGFNFYLGEVHKDEFSMRVEDKARELINVVKTLAPTTITIDLERIDIISYSKVRLNILINEKFQEEIEVNIET